MDKNLLVKQPIADNTCDWNPTPTIPDRNLGAHLLKASKLQARVKADPGCQHQDNGEVIKPALITLGEAMGKKRSPPVNSQRA